MQFHYFYPLFFFSCTHLTLFYFSHTIHPIYIFPFPRILIFVITSSDPPSSSIASLFPHCFVIYPFFHLNFLFVPFPPFYPCPSCFYLPRLIALPISYLILSLFLFINSQYSSRFSLYLI